MCCLDPAARTIDRALTLAWLLPLSWCRASHGSISMGMFWLQLDCNAFRSRPAAELIGPGRGAGVVTLSLSAGRILLRRRCRADVLTLHCT
jgi:hypothetical protein